MRFMRLSTRAITAAIFSVLLGACSIGEGNGIVSIEIVEFDGTDDYEMRADQCEGLLLALVATFTDGQRTVYTHRADWSIETGDGALEELKNDNGFTTAVEILPTVTTTSGDEIIVTAKYLGLVTNRSISVNDTNIESLQLEPAVAAIITGQTQAVSALLVLSDGTVVQNPVRAIDAEIDATTAFTLLEDTNSAGQQQLQTTDTTGTTNLTVTFCSRLDGENASANSARKTAMMTASHYSGSDALLQITENFDGRGISAADGASTYRLPTDSSVAIGGQLKFPNNVVIPLSASSLEWTASDTEGPCNEVNDCPATIDELGTISIASRGAVSINASFTTVDDIELLAAQPLDLTIADVNYQDPAFSLRDESNLPIDTTVSPALSMAFNTGRILSFVALLVDDLGNADMNDDVNYELPVNPGFALADDTDATFLTAANGTIAAVGDEANSNVLINVTSTGLPGAAEVGFSNNIEQFGAELHLLAPSDIFIDSDDNLTTSETGTAISLNVGDTIQLNSVLPFMGEDPVLRNGATAWSTDDTSIAAVGALSNPGLVTALSEGTVVIKAAHNYTDASDTDYLSTATITVNVTTAP